MKTQTTLADGLSAAEIDAVISRSDSSRFSIGAGTASVGPIAAGVLTAGSGKQTDWLHE
jgi:hypothetical protein